MSRWTHGWGSVGLYSKGEYYNEGTSGVTFTGTYSANEAIKIYADEESPNLVGVTDIDFSDIFGADVWLSGTTAIVAAPMTSRISLAVKPTPLPLQHRANWPMALARL